MCEWKLIYSNVTGERQANINIVDETKNSVILESEATKMDQVNRAQGWIIISSIIHIVSSHLMFLCCNSLWM